MCDSQHDESTPCPALTSEDLKAHIISCRVTSRAAGIKAVPFRSKTLTKYFLTENAMKVSPFIYVTKVYRILPLTQQTARWCLLYGTHTRLLHFLLGSTPSGI